MYLRQILRNIIGNIYRCVRTSYSKLTIIRPVTFFTVQKSIERSKTTATNTPIKDEENKPPNKYTNSAADRNATWQRLIPGLRKARPD